MAPLLKKVVLIVHTKMMASSCMAASLWFFLRLLSHSPFFISRACSLFIKQAFLGCSAPQALQTLVAQGMTWGQLGRFFLLETMLSEKKRKQKEKVIYV